MILVIVALIVLAITRVYLVIPKRDRAHHQKKSKRTKPCKTCVFLGSGGHTGEMLQLMKSLNSSHYYPRTYIVTNTDSLSKEKAIAYEQSTGQQNDFNIYTIPRAREMGQPWSRVPLTVLAALVASVKIIVTAWPDLIVCNGPGSCIPVCMLAYIPRVLGIKKMEIIYIESFARVESLSITGKLLYPFVDRFLVQWPQLSNMFDKAEYRGILV
ncbi:glycosyltransferase family 1 protein [Mucor lusitanicus]|uniref:UDP-N-acetylglucosamine transferase subunit ALG14 n=2 Tax=Mucor circinelloides f. lusitanicus TaxID=29924 RepID=A0A168JYA8_MUCCL|nr:glycosyltransferase family 1 protein [Mucor lusitanicus]OAD01762.1 glycosyltransferase family 1 protein [Mucor lusitanicus CBS 277.49]